MRTIAFTLALLGTLVPATAADLGRPPRGPAGPYAVVPLAPVAPAGLSGMVVSRVAGPVALARVDAERTDVKSSRIPEGGYVTGPDGRFLLPLDAGLWTVGALAYGTWHRRPAIPVLPGTVTDIVIWVP